MNFRVHYVKNIVGSSKKLTINIQNLIFSFLQDIGKCNTQFKVFLLNLLCVCAVKIYYFKKKFLFLTLDLNIVIFPCILQTIFITSKLTELETVIISIYVILPRFT